MTHEISSLMDGELDPVDAARAIKNCQSSAESARAWNEYHLIGEALRHRDVGDTNVSARVMAALAAEPTVLAPRPSRVMAVTRIALAAAASVATVAVVGWIGFTGTSTPSTPVVATTAPSGPGLDQPGATRTVNHTVAPQASEVHDYAAAHRQTASSEYYRPAAATAPARP